jgi:acyl-CoA thioester hydrolase
LSIPATRALRARATDAERLLWSRLQNRALAGAKFRRQVPFPPYTVDFCCFEAKLIVELDGSQHVDQVEYDGARTARLESDGFSVVRFRNQDVLANTNGVLEALMAELLARGAPFEPPPLRPKTLERAARTRIRRRVMAARSSVPSPLAGEGQGEGASAGKNSVTPHIHRVRVYFEDTDAGGMVYYANYLKFAERARTEMLRASGISHAEMVADDGLMLVVRRVAAEYRRSARLDDALEIETRLADMTGATLTLDQTVRCGGEVLVELVVTIACITREGRPTRLPERVRAAIAIN